MAVPIRVPSRCGMKTLFSLMWPLASASPRDVLGGCFYFNTVSLGGFQVSSAPPKSFVLLTIMVSDVFIPWRRMATSVKTSMRGP